VVDAGGPTIHLRSVNVSLPRPLGRHRGSVVHSGIAKQPAPAGTWLALTTLNLEGDAQADLTVHGGPDKAVYAYPAEHLPAWSDDLSQPGLGPAAFGENLTTEGATEAEVGIGDVWAWGDARLQVCQPRWPCYKLTLHRDTPEVGPRMRVTGRTGWYLRVLEPGRVPVDGPVTVVERHPAGLSVLDAHWAMADRHLVGRGLVEALAALGELADEWRLPLVGRLDDARSPG
jgi:MOSC domain-containing protein YiiM